MTTIDFEKADYCDRSGGHNIERMSKRVIVTGATGTIGKDVVRQLSERGADVVAVVRDPAKADALVKSGVKVASATFEDAASLRAAFAGADTVVSITPANARAAEQAAAVLDAARQSGVRRIVRVSALKADPEGPTDNTRQHGRTEAALRASGLTWVILRPHFFMQNLLHSLGGILRDGKLHFGVGDGRMGMIDTRDVADAVVAAVSTSEHDGKTFELTGPASIDHHAVAAAIGRGLGRDVQYVSVSPEAASEAVRAFGADDWTVGLVRDYCTAYSKGFGDFTTDDVQRITGHAPRSIDDFVREVLVPAAR